MSFVRILCNSFIKHCAVLHYIYVKIVITPDMNLQYKLLKQKILHFGFATVKLLIERKNKRKKKRQTIAKHAYTYILNQIRVAFCYLRLCNFMHRKCDDESVK